MYGTAASGGLAATGVAVLATGVGWLAIGLLVAGGVMLVVNRHRRRGLQP